MTPAQLHAAIDKAIKIADELMPVSAPNEDISQRFDSTAHSKTKPVKDALDSVVNRIETYKRIPNDSLVPVATLQTANELLEKIERSLREVLNAIRKQEGNQMVQRQEQQWFDEKTALIRRYEAEFAQLLQPWLPSPVESKLTEIELLLGTLSAAEEKLKKTQSAAENIETSLDAKTKEAAATILSDVNVQELDSAITSHERWGLYWLLAFCATCLFTLRLIVWVFVANDNLAWPIPCLNIHFPTPPLDPTIAQAIMSVFSKVVIISFGLGLCLTAARIYQVHLHNAVVNRQRRMALVSFTKLLKAIGQDDAKSREELIAEAARAIFAQSSTGFLQKSNNEFTPYAPIVAELLRNRRTGD